MTGFSKFILLAEMRTGSNFLEMNLNKIEGLTCLGEAFNPYFIGEPGWSELCGMNMEQRDKDPDALLDRIFEQPGVPGFRFFHEHDRRILDRCLEDRDCAKIILTRNPVECYVSWRAARYTDIWRLTNTKFAVDHKVDFRPDQFQEFVQGIADFQSEVAGVLKRTAQTAFHLTYDDLRNLDVLNGLAEWLGVPGRLGGLDRTLKKQALDPLEDRVSNPEVLRGAMQDMDPFGLTTIPNLEPLRGPIVPSWVAPARSGLLYQPLQGGPVPAVQAWLEALDGAPLARGFTRNKLRRWYMDHPGHRSFTVLRHPVARAHAAFCELILPVDVPGFSGTREILRMFQDVAIPPDAPGADYNHAKGFRSFLSFLKRNLAAQTGLKVEDTWASQLHTLQGFAALKTPDLVLREDDLAEGLSRLAQQVGVDAPPVPEVTDPHAARLAEIYDDGMEKLCRKIYQKDYEGFGFGPWR